MKILRLISYLIILVIVILGVSFAITNDTPVTLKYYLGTATLPLSLLLVYTLGLGIILGFVANLWPYFKLRNQNRQLKNQLKQLQLEKERASLPV
ncbi:MAG: LapA family protein [Gammaproteobacteria bacterium]